MSEAPLPQTESQSDQPPKPQSLSAGALLRQAREAAGLHVAALAVSMKIPVKKLEALEADRLDLLPDAVFVRALASSVCRALKMDPAPVLQRLPQTAIPRLDTEQRGINEPFHVSGHATHLTMPAFLARPTVWVVVILLAAAAALIVFPDVQRLDKDSETSVASVSSSATPSQTAMAAEPVEPKSVFPAVDVAVSAAPPVSAPALITPEVVASIVKPASAVALSATPTPVPAVVVSSVPVPQAPRPAMSPALQPAKMDTSAPAIDLARTTTGLVVFKVQGTSWVEVTDAKGVVQLRKTLFAGETSAASGALPLAVVVGRADMTQVEVRGKPLALAGIAKDNVARFEVK